MGLLTRGIIYRWWYFSDSKFGWLPTHLKQSTSHLRKHNAGEVKCHYILFFILILVKSQSSMFKEKEHAWYYPNQRYHQSQYIIYPTLKLRFGSDKIRRKFWWSGQKQKTQNTIGSNETLFVDPRRRFGIAKYECNEHGLTM